MFDKLPKLVSNLRQLFPSKLVLLAGGILLGMSLPASAQDGGDIWAKAGCFNCHGNLATGGEDNAFPTGPNLRRSGLDAATLRDVIACGLPGSPMPANLTGAYTETPCFGMPLGPAPDVTVVGGLTAEEIDVLVEFLMTNVLGVTRVTRENCAAFFGGNPNDPTCLAY